MGTDRPRARWVLEYPTTIAFGLAYAAIYTVKVGVLLGAVALAIALTFAAGQRWATHIAPAEPESAGVRIALVLAIVIVAAVLAATSDKLETFYLVVFPAMTLVPAATAIDRGVRVHRRQNRVR